MRPDEVPAPLEVGPNLGMDTRNRLGDRDRIERGQDVLDEGAPAISASTRRAMHPMKELADRDNADRALFVPDKRFEPLYVGVPLPLDQQVGVDQDGQAPSGGATVLRAARTSSTKSSSTLGAFRISSRKRSGETARAFAGLITATGAPERTTSISSPPATRLSTSEKRRATSVALSLVTPPNLSDKSDGWRRDPRVAPPSPLQRVVDCAARRIEDFLSWLAISGVDFADSVACASVRECPPS